jgi:hypothetical protein
MTDETPAPEAPDADPNSEAASPAPLCPVRSGRRAFLKRAAAGTLGAVLGGAVAGCAGANRSTAAPSREADFRSNWPAGVERPWLGPRYWANPLQDWRLADGRAEMVNASGEDADRNVQLLTHVLTGGSGRFAMRVRAGFADRPGRGRAGFLLGVRGPMDDYRSHAVYGTGLKAGLTARGQLFIGDRRRALSGASFEKTRGAVLEIEAQSPAGGEGYRLVLRARDPETGAAMGRVERDGIAASQLEGLAALLAAFTDAENAENDATGEWGDARVWFEDWRVRGDTVEAHPERTFGPILFNQYTLNRGTLKMTAQLPPVGDADGDAVRLQTQAPGGGGAWDTIAEAPVDALSRTATFRVPGWDDARDVPYRLVYRYRAGGGMKTDHHEGTVRRDPVDQDDLVVGGLSCRYRETFPHRRVAEGVRFHDPDLLTFMGDQYYEGSAGGYGLRRGADVDLRRATLDVLRKWILHGWAFGDLMKDRPTITIADDHDVYQGNLWGEGGTTVDRMALHDNGGYIMPPEWINAVQRMQTAHLPEPPDPAPARNGIGVYYTDLVYGRVGFAVLEDRKWKSGPDGLVPAHPGRSDHVEDLSNIDPGALDTPDAELLGARQLRFLDEWTADWRGADMKAAISQTTFSQLPTHHAAGGWPPTTFKYLAADLDTNGWPQHGRDAAVRRLRKGRAFHLGGDQHLPMILHYGLDDFDDAGINFCVPAIASIYPRGFWPSRMPADGQARFEAVEKFQQPAGRYTDGLGNEMTVRAVANPAYDFRQTPPLARQSDRSAGYGIVRFHKPTREITMEAWPIRSDPRGGASEQFAGWPQTVAARQNDGRAAAAHLPPVEVRGATDPVVQVVDEAEGDVLYTQRIRGRSFRPKVFRKSGAYTVRVSRTGGPWQETFEGVRPDGDRATLEVQL